LASTKTITRHLSAAGAGEKINRKAREAREGFQVQSLSLCELCELCG
jgi:hypothetical protein